MVTIEVASAHVDELRAAALGLYAVKAEALHLATNEYLSDRVSLGPVIGHRDEARAVEGLIDQLGWHFAPVASRVEVRGCGRLLAELLGSALIVRLETLIDALTRTDTETCIGMGSVGSSLGEAGALAVFLDDVRAQEGHRDDRIVRATTATSC